MSLSNSLCLSRFRGRRLPLIAFWSADESVAASYPERTAMRAYSFRPRTSFVQVALCALKFQCYTGERKPGLQTVVLLTSTISESAGLNTAGVGSLGFIDVINSCASRQQETFMLSCIRARRAKLSKAKDQVAVLDQSTTDWRGRAGTIKRLKKV